MTHDQSNFSYPEFFAPKTNAPCGAAVDDPGTAAAAANPPNGCFAGGASSLAVVVVVDGPLDMVDEVPKAKTAVK